MAIEYQRNTWETGKVITAKALNDIETGIVNIVETLNGMDGEVTSQTLTARGDANIGGTATVTGKATFNGPVEINGTTAINDNITVGANTYIILSASPSESNHAATKGYVDNKTINSGNTGIVSSGKLGIDNGITLTLQPATAERLGGIKVGSNLNIDNQGVLSATDTTYSVASANADGLMSSAHFSKLNGLSIKTPNTSAVEPANDGLITLSNVVDGINVYGIAQSFSSGIVNIKGVVTGIKLDENTTISPSSTAESGIIDISAKANLDSPTFSGIVNFGDQISIDTNDNKITINQTDITEQKINALYNLPSIPPLSSDDPDGTYTLQAQKTGTNITYSWVSVSQQESGGEGS